MRGARSLGRWGLAALLAACGGCALAPVAEPAPEPQVAARQPRPLLPAQRRTTAGEVYVRNLSAQAEVVAARAAATGNPAWRLQQAQLQYFLGRLEGRTAGLEASAATVAALRAELPADPALLLLDARLHSALHRFDQAGAALAAARAAGAPAAQVGALAADLQLAQGRADAASAALRSLPEATWEAQAARANLLVERGRLDQAERLFERAQRLYAGTNPYPLAWIHTQHGIALLRNGQVARARDYFAAAHARLPRFVLAAEHLAETELLLGRPDAAAALYRAVVAVSDDPEHQAGLAAAEQARGNAPAAAAALQAAGAGYAAWLDRQPAAFWQHAAAFYSEIGEHATALDLARRNRALRGDAGSALLLAEVALAAGDPDLACAELAYARGSGLAPPELATLSARLPQCAPAPAVDTAPGRDRG